MHKSLALCTRSVSVGDGCEDHTEFLQRAADGDAMGEHISNPPNELCMAFPITTPLLRSRLSTSAVAFSFPNFSLVRVFSLS